MMVKEVILYFEFLENGKKTQFGEKSWRYESMLLNNSQEGKYLDIKVFRAL